MTQKCLKKVGFCYNSIYDDLEADDTAIEL